MPSSPDEKIFVSADFAEAVKQFRKLEKAGEQLDQTLGKLTRSFPKAEKGFSGLVRKITEISPGVIKAETELTKLFRGVKSVGDGMVTTSNNLGRVTTNIFHFTKRTTEASGAVTKLASALSNIDTTKIAALSNIGARSFDRYSYRSSSPAANRIAGNLELERLVANQNAGDADFIGQTIGRNRRLGILGNRAIAGDREAAFQRRIQELQLELLGNRAIAGDQRSARARQGGLSALGILGNRAIAGDVTAARARQGGLSALGILGNRAIAGDREAAFQRRIQELQLELLGNRAIAGDQRSARVRAGRERALIGLGNRALEAPAVAAGAIRPASGRFTPAQISASQNLLNAKRALADLTAEAKKSDGIFGRLGLFQTARYYALFRGLTLIKDGFVDVGSASHELVTRLNEIRTITQDSGFTFEDFRDQVLGVSDALGFAAEDVAEATYQALSNQVVDAGEAMGFLQEASEFARVTNSSLTDSVSLLSSALKGFELDSSRAREASAILFRTIELGRLRAEDLADTFGRVSRPAQALGISLNEIGAALSAITVTGIPVSQALTELRGITTKLIKPSEEMTKYLQELGYENAQAAIATEGFTNFLADLSEEVDGNISRLGEFFTRVRGLNGAITLTGKTTNEFRDILRSTGDELAHLDVAKQFAIAENAALTVTKQLNELRNSFIRLGIEVVKGLANINTEYIQLTKVVKIAAVGIGFLTARWVAMRIATIAARYETAKMTIALAAANAGATSTATSVKALGVAFGGLTANIGALIATGLVTWFLNAKAEAAAFKEEVKTGVAEAIFELTEELSNKTTPTLEKIDEKFKELGKTLAETRKELQVGFNLSLETTETLLDRVSKALETDIDAIEQRKKAAVDGEKDIQKEIKETQRKREEAIRKSIDAEEKFAEEREQKRFDEKISTLDPARQLTERELKDAEYTKKIAALGNSPEDAEKRRRLTESKLKNLEELEKIDTDRVPNVTRIGYKNDAVTRKRDYVLSQLEILRKRRKSVGGRKTQREIRLEQQAAELEGQIQNDPNTARGRIRQAEEDQIRAEKEHRIIQNSTAQDQIKLLETKATALETEASSYEKSIEALKALKPLLEFSADKTVEMAENTVLFVRALKEGFPGLDLSSSIAAGLGANTGIIDLGGRKTALDRLSGKQNKILSDRREREKAVRAILSSGRQSLVNRGQILESLIGLSDFGTSKSAALEILNLDEDARPISQNKKDILRFIARNSGAFSSLTTFADDRSKDIVNRRRAGQSPTQQLEAINFSAEQIAKIKSLAAEASTLDTQDTEGINEFVDTINTLKRLNKLLQNSGSVDYNTPKGIIDKIRGYDPKKGASFDEKEKKFLDDLGVGNTNLFSSEEIQLGGFNSNLSAATTTLDVLAIAARTAADALFTITGDPSASAAVRTATNAAAADIVPGTESRAFGGFGVGRGIFHPGEFIVNKKAARLYRPYLEQINRGDARFFPGQYGGRTGTFDVTGNALPIRRTPVNRLGISTSSFTYGSNPQTLTTIQISIGDVIVPNHSGSVRELARGVSSTLRREVARGLGKSVSV